MTESSPSITDIRMPAPRSHQRLCAVAVIIGVSIFLIINSIVNILPDTTIWTSPSHVQDEYDSLYKEYLLEQKLYEGEHVADYVGDDFYGVIFDAGSTGSRVHVLQFRPHKDSHPTLVHEQFNLTTHGLSEFADSPIEGARSLEGLLNVAQTTVPAKKWAETPIALKATAGLRLLPKKKADDLLDATYQLLADSGFHLESPEKTISIMDGDEEGEYIWVTLNFLLGALDSKNISYTTMGALDLGGGSTQITFIPTSESTYREGGDRAFIKDFRYMDSSFKLYTHSYLGLGMMEARLQTMKLDNLHTTTLSTDFDGTFFKSVCLAPNTNGTWMFGENKYMAVSALTDITQLYNKCKSITQQFLSTKDIHSPDEIHTKEFYAMSYFYARARDLGMIDADKGGVVTVQEEIEAAKNVCSTVNKDEPFLCMDQVFISSLLSTGYKFKPDVKLHIAPKINGFEVSWALGAAIDLMHTHWDHLGDENQRR